MGRRAGAALLACCQAGVAGPGSGVHKAGKGAPAPGFGVPGLLDQIQRFAGLGAPVGHEVGQDHLAPFCGGQGPKGEGPLAGQKARQHSRGAFGWAAVGGQIEGWPVADPQAVEALFTPKGSLVNRQDLGHAPHRRALQQGPVGSRKWGIKADAQSQLGWHSHDRGSGLVQPAVSGGDGDPRSVLADRHDRLAQLHATGIAGLEGVDQQRRHLAGSAAHQPGLGALGLGGHRLGPGEMQDRGLPGFKAAGAPHPAQPVERQLGQGDGGVLLSPLGHREPIQLLGVGGEPGLDRVHPGHQFGKGPLQTLAGGQLIAGQAEGLGLKEQQALVKAIGQGGHDPPPLPVEHPLTEVMAGVSGQCQLVEQGRKAAMADAAPLTAQIDHGPMGRGHADHAPADAGAGLQHPHALP